MNVLKRIRGPCSQLQRCTVPHALASAQLRVVVYQPPAAQRAFFSKNKKEIDNKNKTQKQLEDKDVFWYNAMRKVLSWGFLTPFLGGWRIKILKMIGFIPAKKGQK